MPDDIKSIRQLIHGLSVGCPHNDPAPDCIISQFRGISFTEAYRVIEKLTESELEQIIRLHKQCFSEREKGLPILSSESEINKK